LKPSIFSLSFFSILFFILNVHAGKTNLAVSPDLTFYSDSSEFEETPSSREALASANTPKTTRALATIRKIAEILPIQGADNIEIAIVDGWKVVVAKNSFHVGDKIIYFEVDSLLPVREEFEFLRKSSFKELDDGRKGFRLRTSKLHGQVSQGLVVPLSLLTDDEGKFAVNDDVTEILGVTKYDIPDTCTVVVSSFKGSFPQFIQKTKERRIQNLSSSYEYYKGKNFFVSEKLDGTSSTFYIKDDKFGVCSRNRELNKTDDSIYWKLVEEHDLEAKLRNLQRNLAIQAEIVGDKIQKNKYNIVGHKMYVFNIFDIHKQEYLPKSEMMKLCKELNLPICPVIFENKKLPDTIDQILLEADGKSQIDPKQNREGLVWVFDCPQSNKRISFKTISNKYLLKAKD
jgi:RNA ligase (TIGR02306 family)